MSNTTVSITQKHEEEVAALHAEVKSAKMWVGFALVAIINCAIYFGVNLSSDPVVSAMCAGLSVLLALLLGIRLIDGMNSARKLGALEKEAELAAQE